MFAPRPIQIRYGDPSELGGLAAASGSAQYNLGERRYTDQRNMQRYQMDYNDYQNRLSADTSFLNSEAQRQAEDTWRRNELDFRYNALNSGTSTANMLQEAGGYGGVRSFSNPARQVAQSAGTMSSGAGRAARPLNLVPAEGSIRQDEGPSMRMITEDGTEYGQYRGGTPYTMASDISPEGREATHEAIRGIESGLPEMVTPGVRSQLDAVRALQGTMPSDQWNSLWAAAKSGQLDMNQVMTQGRQMMPSSGGGRRTAWTRDVEEFTSEYNELGVVQGFAPDQQLAYARRKLNLPPKNSFGEGYDDEEVMQRLQAYTQEMTAFSRPVTNSSGGTPTGGNTVPITSDTEYRALPSGTWYAGPDGVQRLKP